MNGFIGSSKIASSGTPSLLSSGSGGVSSGGSLMSGGSSAASSASSGGIFEITIINMHVINTSGGDPSVGDFTIESIGSIGGTITAITGDAPGFTPFPASGLPHHMGVGDSLYVFCTTDPTEILSGTELRVDYVGDDGDVGFLLVVWSL